MAGAERAGVGAGAVLVLTVPTVLVWLLALAMLSSLGGSDAAGNALGEAYAAIGVILLWALLGLITLITVLKGAMPWPLAAAAVVLVPASGFAAFGALELLSKAGRAPFLWPIVIPALTPPLIAAFCICSVLPAVRSAAPMRFAGPLVWFAVALVSIAIVPLQQVRDRLNDAEATIRQKIDAEYASLPANARLPELAPFLSKLRGNAQDDLVTRIRGLPDRQRDAETMLERGDFPLGYLGRIDLEPSPVLCEKARVTLRRGAEPLTLPPGTSKPYALIAERVGDALAAMQWLVGYDCACDAESLAWEIAAKNYADTNFDVVELARLRDPQELGRIVRRNPEHFSMLTQRSHLKAWLKFAEDPKERETVLAGARALDHRTADAVEMLQDKYDIAAPWTALAYLPVLALEPTPALCAVALTEIRKELAGIYHPPPDDPPPYRELVQRLGRERQFPALIWLAENGCNAQAALSEGIALVRAYNDSPERATMLAQLQRLQR